MTQEDAIVQIYGLKKYCEDMADSDESGSYVFDLDVQALDLALSVLRPITREQAEKMRGEWIDCDGGKFPVDKYGQPCGWAKCSACGEYLTASDEYPCIGHFCPNCGAPMTDKAVDMVMERLEALYGQENT